MKLHPCPPTLAPDLLRAMGMIARAAEGVLGRPQQAMLDAIQQIVLASEIETDNLASISFEELGQAVDDPDQALQLVRLMIMISLASGPPSEEQVSILTSTARTLGVDEPAVGVVSLLSRNQMRRFRFAFLRRSHVRTYLRNTRRMLGGVLPTIKAMLVLRGVLPENADLSARFRALERLPEETLGYQFFVHFTKEGLAFPGEKGGFPIGALYHDFTHLLAGYDTTPEGELKNAAFQAGYTSGDEAFFTSLFAILIHTSGINVAPFPMPVLPGRIGQGNLALEMLHGWQRGAAMKTDLADCWDFWEYVDMPIAAVREQLGVVPLESEWAQG